jgi:hypothetical protein
LSPRREGVIASLEVSNLPLNPDEISTHLLNLILTLNPVDFSILATHHYDSLGIAMNGSLRCIALTGMGNTAHPVILTISSLFASTNDHHCTPLYNSLFKTHDKPIADLQALVPFKGVLHHIPKAALLPPYLYLLILDRSWSTPHDLLHAVIKIIASLVPPTPSITNDTPADDIKDPDTAITKDKDNDGAAPPPPSTPEQEIEMEQTDPPTAAPVTPARTNPQSILIGPTSATSPPSSTPSGATLAQPFAIG